MYAYHIRVPFLAPAFPQSNNFWANTCQGTRRYSTWSPSRKLGGGETNTHWLSGRRQRNVINCEGSSWTSVKSWVPQGSALGQILLFICVNDMLIRALSAKSQSLLITPNWKSTDPTPESSESLQHDLDRIGKWYETWQMSFNTDKGTVMHIGRANRSVNYSLFVNKIPITKR